MGTLVDTSVWSLAFRRDASPDVEEVDVLRRALSRGDVVATGIILLELLRGFLPQRAQETIRSAFDAVELLEPTRDDYVGAASLANACRRAGVQLGSIDALIAQLAIAGGHVLLTTDRDFHAAAPHVALHVWGPVRGEG